MKINFKNKNVIVVGSSKGIGKGVYDTFNKLEANVFGISRSSGVDIINISLMPDNIKTEIG